MRSADCACAMVQAWLLSSAVVPCDRRRSLCRKSARTNRTPLHADRKVPYRNLHTLNSMVESTGRSRFLVGFGTPRFRIGWQCSWPRSHATHSRFPGENWAKSTHSSVCSFKASSPLSLMSALRPNLTSTERWMYGRWAPGLSESER
jgi:hypothetical protein